MHPTENYIDLDNCPVVKLKYNLGCGKIYDNYSGKIKQTFQLPLNQACLYLAYLVVGRRKKEKKKEDSQVVDTYNSRIYYFQ